MINSITSYLFGKGSTDPVTSAQSSSIKHGVTGHQHDVTGHQRDVTVHQHGAEGEPQHETSQGKIHGGDSTATLTASSE